MNLKWGVFASKTCVPSTLTQSLELLASVLVFKLIWCIQTREGTSEPLSGVVRSTSSLASRNRWLPETLQLCVKVHFCGIPPSPSLSSSASWPVPTHVPCKWQCLILVTCQLLLGQFTHPREAPVFSTVSKSFHFCLQQPSKMLVRSFLSLVTPLCCYSLGLCDQQVKERLLIPSARSDWIHNLKAEMLWVLQSQRLWEFLPSFQHPKVLLPCYHECGLESVLRAGQEHLISLVTSFMRQPGPEPSQRQHWLSAVLSIPSAPRCLPETSLLEAVLCFPQFISFWEPDPFSKEQNDKKGTSG